MNTSPTLYRDLTCGAGAAFITVMLSLTFVQSTAYPPGTHTRAALFMQVQPQHAWFGQPEPAVLVD
ncbi:MAG TPA: hypothetical protein VEQ14_05860 [Steroidobacteraceae bacterium]|jgi:hypothetical protein|nr:hypothetical protein [Steroidobacteraceae bacterium]